MSETARQRSMVQRSLSRTTLQPSVQDLNGNIITKGMDEDPVVWLVGRSTSKIVPSTDYCFPVPASFRKGGAFGPERWESLVRPGLPVSLGTAPVPTSLVGEMHRRHVARTARDRARLTPKQRMTDRVIPTSPTYDEESTFSLSLPLSGSEAEFDAKLTTRTGTPKPEHTARSRPSTTGRYFDTSNGLRNSKSRMAWRSRPSTAGQWVAGPGMRIQKLTLHPKADYTDLSVERRTGVTINGHVMPKGY